jgi:hypothetical protein
MGHGVVVVVVADKVLASSLRVYQPVDSREHLTMDSKPVRTTGVSSSSEYNGLQR